MDEISLSKVREEQLDVTIIDLENRIDDLESKLLRAKNHYAILMEKKANLILKKSKSEINLSSYSMTKIKEVEDQKRPFQLSPI